MTNKKHFGELKANARVTYLKDLPAAVELHDYLETLKEKYGVSFGKVNLNSAIISYLFIDNVIFLAGISQRIIPYIFPSYTRMMDKKHPAYEFYKKWNVFGMPGLTIEEWNELMSDIEKLKKLHEEYLNNHQ